MSIENGRGKASPTIASEEWSDSREIDKHHTQENLTTPRKIPAPRHQAKPDPLLDVGALSQSLPTYTGAPVHSRKSAIALRSTPRDFDTLDFRDHRREFYQKNQSAEHKSCTT